MAKITSGRDDEKSEDRIASQMMGTELADGAGMMGGDPVRTDPTDGDLLRDIPTEELEMLDDFAAQLQGEMTPDAVQQLFDGWVRTLPPEAPVGDIAEGFQENYDAWVAEGAPPFPDEGLSAHDLFEGPQDSDGTSRSTDGPGLPPEGHPGMPPENSPMIGLEPSPAMMAQAEEFASSLAGTLPPDAVESMMNKFLDGLPEDAPVDDMAVELQAGFHQWVADGAPPFPPDGLTVEELFGADEPPEGDFLDNMPAHVHAMIKDFACALAGELTPDQVQALIKDFLAGLPPEAPIDDVAWHVQAGFDEWMADGAPPFPPDGMTVDELFGDGPESDMDPDMSTDLTGEAGLIPPPHPTGVVNPFVEPLFKGAPGDTDGGPAWGLNYNHAAPSQSVWTLPLSPDAVDLDDRSITVPAGMVGDTPWLPPEARNNGDGTYTINSWPISEMVDNGDGTISLTVDIGPPPQAPPD